MWRQNLGKKYQQKNISWLWNKNQQQTAGMKNHGLSPLQVRALYVSCHFMQRLLRFITSILIAISLAFNCVGQNKNIDSSHNQATLSLLQFVLRDSVPHITNWTIDYGELFTIVQRKILDSIVSKFERASTIEICIFTLDSTMATKEGFDDFVLHIHNTLGVGKKMKNNGIVIGISQSLKKIRISNGYGIEKMLGDSETKHIIDTEFIPFFKQSDYYGGTLNGLKYLITKLEEKMKKSY